MYLTSIFPKDSLGSKANRKETLPDWRVKRKPSWGTRCDLMVDLVRDVVDSYNRERDESEVGGEQ